MSGTAAPVRRLGRLVETVHAVVYFAPEAATAYADVGCRGWWMGYFASRSAALGPVGPAPVTAMFHGFAPRLVARALPDAWRLCATDAVLDARLRVADAALTRALGDQVSAAGVAELADVLGAAVPLLPAAGRPLFAAHAALPVPAPPHLALWHATTALREFRGDGHVAALVTAGLDGLAANVLAAAVGLVDPAQQPVVRGWTEAEWSAAVAALAADGLVGPDGRATEAGRTLRENVEQTTDRLAQSLADALGAAGVARAVALLEPLAAAVVAAAAVPFPNPIALPPPV